MSNDRYEMSISLNVLNHLGLNLYSNTPAVLAEVIANSWDADTTEVHVDFDIQNKTITIVDNGIGMDVSDINEKYLFVGKSKRNGDADFKTPRGRKPMGRKGIGKLSLFSIAKKISVYTRKAGGDNEAFLMDADEIEKIIRNEDPTLPKRYAPTPISFDADIGCQGTLIKIEELKNLRLTEATVAGLRKRLARRFGLMNSDTDLPFQMFVQGKEVEFADRDYFHKARFLFQYGDYDYAKHCNNLDTDSNAGNKKLSFPRPGRFDIDGKPDANGEYEISGWIAIARSSKDLDGGTDEDDNLNKITVVVRNKVAQEDILSEFRIGGMMTKFVFGEIYAEFLDQDDKPDIATSNRQKHKEDDERYVALRRFLDGDLRRISTEVDKLKEDKGVEEAIKHNPHIKEWYDGLYPPQLKDTAKKVFAAIDRAGVDGADRNALYADGIVSFESRKIHSALKLLEEITPENIPTLLRHLSSIDEIEAEHYHNIVKGRLSVIAKIDELNKNKAYEHCMRDYIAEHLWLLDPAWERATEYLHVEKSLKRVIDGVRSSKKTVRPDIRYRRVANAHVVIELKRRGRRVDTFEIQQQIVPYIRAVKEELQKDTPGNRSLIIETFCILDPLPENWDDPEFRRASERSLEAYGIRVQSYKELINNAYSAYSKYITDSAKAATLRELLNKIRNHQA